MSYRKLIFGCVATLSCISILDMVYGCDIEAGRKPAAKPVLRVYVEFLGRRILIENNVLEKWREKIDCIDVCMVMAHVSDTCHFVGYISGMPHV